VQVPQIGEFTSGIQEIWRNFTYLNVPSWGVYLIQLVTTQDISIVRVPHIGEFISGVRETQR
jgi:hypothetical protein